MPKELFDILKNHAFDDNHCFVCGTKLDRRNRTVEHVFPKWLQEAFDLKDKTITLLNKTRITYKNLVVPCCYQCNGIHLSKLENRIRTIILDDEKSIDEIEPQDLNAWVSKIYIGVLWKELSLIFDRRNPDSGPILSTEIMNNFRMVHMFMQSCRQEMKFLGLGSRFPNSIITTKCVLDNSHGSFDYLDSIEAHAVAIRMGEKGIICVFDGGLHDFVFPKFSEEIFERKALHPVQFQEVFSKLAYKSMLSLKVPYFGFVQDEMTGTITVGTLAFDDQEMSARILLVKSEEGLAALVPILPDSAFNSPCYDEWSQSEYARVLSMYTGIPIQKLFHPPDMVATTLRDSNGNFVEMYADPDKKPQ